MNNVQTQNAAVSVESAEDQIAKVEKALADAQFEAQYGLDGAAENVAKLQLMLVKLRKEVAEEEKAARRAASIGRFKKAAERATLEKVKDIREAMEVVTDDDELLKSMISSAGRSCIYQIVYLESRYEKACEASHVSYGRENYYDGATESGENSRDWAGEADKFKRQIAELDTLAIAYERIYNEVQDRLHKAGLISTEYLRPCYNEGNVIGALDAARRQREVRQASWVREQQAKRQAVSNAMPSIDRMLSE